MDSLSAKKKLLSVKHLPTSPRIVQEVIKLWQNPKVSIRDYQAAISKDPGLTAEVLKVVNSPFYGLKNRVSNLQLALSMLGLKETYRLVTNSGFQKVFRTIFTDISYDLNLYWRHCQTTANTAYLLAGKFHPSMASEAFAAGLLHDVGKLVMEQFFHSEWQQLMRKMQITRDIDTDVEEEIFGMDHCEMGATLLVRWNLPREIILPVRYHHSPPDAPAEKELVLITYFAEQIATYLMSESDRNTIREFFREDALWFKMCHDYPEMNILEAEDFLTHWKPQILRRVEIH